MMGDEERRQSKVHNAPHSGRKAEKKRKKLKPNQDDISAQKRNPKAFAVQSIEKAARQFRRTMDIQMKKQRMPEIDRTVLEPPPIVVGLVGPPKVGKTTLMQCLIKNFCRHSLSNIHGPVTIVSGKKRRLTLIECNNDINSMIDLAKVADLILLLVDASFGFEMETFEFLNICQVHGFPKIMGVLTHLDAFKNVKTLRRTKKQMKHRFWKEIYPGAKLFYLSGMIHGKYLQNEIHNLGRFVSVMKFHPQLWRASHSYMLADRVEDLTDPDLIRREPKCDRTICVYGFTRGAPMKNRGKVHIPGCGDFPVKDVSFLPDPCPLPDKEKRRALNEKERLLYAPMSGVGGIVYDKDAVYIDLGGSHSHNQVNETEDGEFLESLAKAEETVDAKIAASSFTLFTGAAPLSGEELVQNDATVQKSNISNDSSSPQKHVRFEDDSDVDETKDEDGDSNYTDISEEDESDDDMNETTISNIDKNETEVVEKFEFADSDMEIENSTLQEEGVLKWKENLAIKAADSYLKRQQEIRNISSIVYGKVADKTMELDEEDESEELGGLLRKVENTKLSKNNVYVSMNRMDSSKFADEEMHDWSLEEVRALIRDCFVTGKWASNQNAETLLEEDDAFGDFEDLEADDVTADKVDDGSGTENKSINPNAEEGKDSAAQKAIDKRNERKRKLKEMFDSEYDGEKGGKTFYDDLKSEVTQQTQLNRSEFENMEDEIRVGFEGFRAGLYIRLEIENIPSELITNFDPSYPLVVGSLLSGEDALGYIQVRIKKHRWYKKILKTRDPLIISVGWRRFQTLPLYSIEDHNGRNRLLKYTPEHMHCLGSFWGPITPQATGFVAFQSVGDIVPDFRIAATGVILDLDKSTQIVKKLKLTGTPLKIYKKTAFIKGMFTTALEVTKFEGASIRTVSGLRGQIKKAIKAPQGTFRATFEDKILPSDIVFMRTWYQVQVPRFYNIVTSLLLPPEEKVKWKGMKTVGQLRREKGIKAPFSDDSQYTAIERIRRQAAPLVIPKDLQRNLPYKDKPKNREVKSGGVESRRVAVIPEPSDQETAKLMRVIKTVFDAKIYSDNRVMWKKTKEHRKEKRLANEKKAQRERNLKKRIFKTLKKMRSVK